VKRHQPTRTARALLAALSLGLSACAAADASSDAPPANPEAAAAPLHEVEIHVPAGLGTMDSGLVDLHGQPVQVVCSACHGAMPKIASMKPAAERAFHKDHALAHGALQCRACHNPENMDTLRLADGSSLAYDDVVGLCGQCHGTQHRDYLHGAHGGMNGHWDLTRGPRVRNACVDCHDPHRPAIRKVTPVLPPGDRFLGTEASHD
jgi:hypothetical protein